jgi:hypothetical protein
MDEHIIRFEIFISDTKIASASCTVRSKKKIEMALINTLQLAARKNLRSFENMKQSVALCLEAEGRHFAHLL